VRAEPAEKVEDRRAFETELRDDLDAGLGLLSPVAPARQQSEGQGFIKIRMAFGVTGHADAHDTTGLQQAAVGDIAAGLERAPASSEIARDEQDARHIGLAAQARQKIVERLG
jgi:hypothetical protein